MEEDASADERCRAVIGNGGTQLYGGKGICAPVGGGGGGWGERGPDLPLAVSPGRAAGHLARHPPNWVTCSTPTSPPTQEGDLPWEELWGVLLPGHEFLWREWKGRFVGKEK
jgi:hypothetical protein